MNRSIRIAKQLIALAKSLVNDEDDTTSTWKIVRVLDKGRREVTIGMPKFNEDDTDEQKLDFFENYIKKVGWKVPDDCDYYVDEDNKQYVLRHDDGRIEFRMFKLSKIRRALGGRSELWKAFKIGDDGKTEEEIKDVTIIMRNNETPRDRETRIVINFNNIGVKLQRRDIKLDNDSEYSIYKNGVLSYKIRKIRQLQK